MEERKLQEKIVFMEVHFLRVQELNLITDQKNDITNADVLDTWFSPAQKIQEIIKNNLPWIIKTSPPTKSEGFLKYYLNTDI